MLGLKVRFMKLRGLRSAERLGGFCFLGLRRGWGFKRLMSLIFLLLVVLMLLSRFVGFPLSVLLVNGYSMYPSLKPGDLLIGLHKNIVGYGIGDVVVWCSSPTYCTVHRVVEVRGSYVITRGDNNPFEDPPIPESLVKYKVVLAIPSMIWLTACFMCLCLYLVWERGRVVRFMRSFRDVEVIVLVFFIVIGLATVAIAPVHYFTMESVIAKPSMNLRSIKLLDPGSLILVNYVLQDLDLSSITGCLIKVGDQLIRCSAYTPTSDRVAVMVPPETYAIAYERGLSSFDVLLNLTLDKGFLIGSYPVYISWSKLSVLVNGNSLILSNPNYVPINITYVRVTYISYDEKLGIYEVSRVEELQGFTVGPKSTYVLSVESGGHHAYVMIKYSFMGGEVIEQKRIDFG
jgi:signal peptidase I